MDKAQMKKGVLELCILHICSEQDRYGYEIMKLVTDASYTPVRAKETPDLAVGGGTLLSLPLVLCAVRSMHRKRCFLACAKGVSVNTKFPRFVRESLHKSCGKIQFSLLFRH